ncbi:hypothetical protein C8Q70DRAFT_1057664 [Cubamyces menziesii]|nr:hypothetical protein C8Q70DRAFT_1057664 [Cubamyces menziesii]
MQFKSNFVVFVVAAVLATAVSAIPLPGSEITSGTGALLDKALVGPNFEVDVRGRSPVRILARGPRHGSGSRGRSGSRSAAVKTIEARRHGSGSRGRGDSRGRRDLEARRHGSGSRGRSGSRSATIKTIEARRHGSGSRGRGDSRGRRDLEARRHGSGSRGRSGSRSANVRTIEARRHGSGSRGRGDSRGRREASALVLKLAVMGLAPEAAAIVTAVANTPSWFWFSRQERQPFPEREDVGSPPPWLWLPQPGRQQGPSSRPVATDLVLADEETAGTVVTSKLVVMARSPVEGAGVARGTPESYRPAVTDRALVAEAIVVDGAPRHVVMDPTPVAEAGVAAARSFFPFFAVGTNILS